MGIVSTTDSTALTGQTGYTIIDTSLTWTSAAPATTPAVTGAATGNMVFTFGITTALANTNTITITASQNIWATGTPTVSCTLTENGGTPNSNFGAVATSQTVLTVTATNAIATGAAVLTCSDNTIVNGATGAVTFDIVSTTDSTALTGQTGYTITAAPTTTTTAAPATTPAVTGAATGNMVFTF